MQIIYCGNNSNIVMGRAKSIKMRDMNPLCHVSQIQAKVK